MMRRAFIAVAFAGICILLATPALTLDLYSFRAQHGLPPLRAVSPRASGSAMPASGSVIRMWAKSGRHRANMLRRDVTSYGIASAEGGTGRRYWVLELGN
jgi:hypothetical protein